MHVDTQKTRSRGSKVNHPRTVAVLVAILGIVFCRPGASYGQIRIQDPVVTKTPRLPPAPGPTGFVVTGTPLVARLSWDATPNAARYALWRSDGVNASVERTPEGFTGTTFQDSLPDPRPTWRYSLVAHYADGKWGEAPVLQFISPPLLNPSVFTANHLGGGKVALQWQAVPGAMLYRLDGPGMSHTGQHQTATTATVPSAPPGPGTWKVSVLYPGNFADYGTATVAQAMVRVLPQRAIPWLSRKGLGSHAEATSHMNYECDYVVNCSGSMTMNLNAFGWPLWGLPTRAASEAVYGNAIDLGVGRRTDCAQRPVAPPYARFITICYSTSHGPGPGEAGFGDPATITYAAAGTQMETQPHDLNNYSSTMLDAWGMMPRGGTMITMDQTGATFMAFTAGTNQSPSYLGNWGFAVTPVRLNTTTFDTEGPKFVPQSCMSCHGGRYNSSTNRVEGASLLPLDPSLLVFSGVPPGDRQSQEENIRKINQIVLETTPSPAVINYIRGLYNDAVSIPGAKAVTDYVPAGWAPQAGFYRSVVRPYCTMCHLAAPASVSFASWANFQQNAPAIHTAVCKAYTMPHSEIAFREFWLKDTGVLFLPGLLAATLGFPSCS